ncbi:MAG TPA: hypothetical protein VE890_02100, partial [Thermoguttaceae bacterium]|nr:hypothetical protein [Thermoguttaceae bacterium]
MNDRENVAAHGKAWPMGLVLVLGVVLTLAAGRCLAQEAAQVSASIDRLIEQLGDKDYFVRERAQAELAKYSFDAFEPLSR